MKTDWQEAGISRFGKRTATLALLLVALCLTFAFSHLLYTTTRADGWVPHSSGTSLALYGVWGDSSSSVFACGDTGTFLHFDGSQWSSLSTGVGNVLYGIWGHSPTDIFVVGNAGTMVHYDGSQWNEMTSGTKNHLNAVWGTASDSVLSAGNKGTILSYNGVSWSSMPTGVTNTLYGIWGSSSTDIFAVGNGGTILHYGGIGWSQMSSNTTSTLWGVWGSSGSDVFAVGNSGCILHYDGTDWAEMPAGMVDNLYCVWGESSNEVFAAGANGTILQFDGNIWTQMTTTANSSLRGIWGSSATDIFAVGDSGTILHYAEFVPVVISASPGQGNQSDALIVTLSGNNFTEVTGVSFGDGVLVEDFSIDSSTQLTANVTIAAEAVTGPRDVSVTNSYGTGVLAAGFDIPHAQLDTVAPGSAYREQSIEVVITGHNLGGATAISFGAGINVTEFHVYDPTQISANITIDGAATIGPRDVTVTTPGSTAQLVAGFTVDSANEPPVAADDSYATDEDEPLVVAAPGVLGNDTDVDGNSLTAVLVSGPSGGILDLNVDGSFSYTPHLDFYGEDTFAYRAYDGLAYSGNATVIITVNPVNDAPAAAQDSYSTDEDATLNVVAPGVLGNDSDTEGSVLTAALYSSPAHGTLNLSSDGSFTYSPHPDFHGTDSFSYRSYDGEAYSNIATVTITVIPANDAPVAIEDSYSVHEDNTLSLAAPGVLANDSDIDADMLSAELVNAATHGSVSLAADGSFTYVPYPDFYGTDTFTYRAFDGTEYSATTTVTLNVVPVNDAPVAVGDAHSLDEDVTLNVTSPGILGNDSDIDTGSLSAVLMSGPAHGTLNLNNDGSFTYTPEPDFYGADSFAYRAYDGVLYSETVTVHLTVSAVNDAPIARDAAYVATAGNILQILSPGVLENDNDVDGDLLTAVLAGSVSHGALTLNADGSFTYSPEANFSGTDAFSYRAFDGSLYSGAATVTLTVNWFNEAPVAVDDAYIVDEDGVLLVDRPGILQNDSDPDGNVLTATLVSGPGCGTLALNPNGSFTYTPDANFHGSDFFTYLATDGVATSEPATVSILVNPVNDAPKASGDTFAATEDQTLIVGPPGILGNDSDTDGDSLKAILISPPGHGAIVLNSDGSFTYTPDPNFVGIDGFSYQACDGSLCSDTIDSTIQVNQAPPLVSALSPSEGVAGQTVRISITGANFSGATSLSFGAGIDVTSYRTESDELITAEIAIGPTAASGARDVKVVTPAGTAGLAGAFKVSATLPVIAGTNPISAPRGQSLEVSVSGNNLQATTAVSFGPGIVVNSFRTVSPEEIMVNISIDSEAIAGPRQVTVSTIGGTGTLPDGFEVTIPAPVVTDLSLTSGERGRTLEVVINGENLDEAREIDLGEGVAVKTFYLDGSTRIVATVTIADDASTGPRDVLVTTPQGTATLPGGFTVEWTLNPSSVWLWLGIGLVLAMLAFFLLVTRRRPTKKWSLLDLQNKR